MYIYIYIMRLKRFVSSVIPSSFTTSLKIGALAIQFAVTSPVHCSVPAKTASHGMRRRLPATTSARYLSMRPSICSATFFRTNELRGPKKKPRVAVAVMPPRVWQVLPGRRLQRPVVFNGSVEKRWPSKPGRGNSAPMQILSMSMYHPPAARTTSIETASFSC